MLLLHNLKIFLYSLMIICRYRCCALLNDGNSPISVNTVDDAVTLLFRDETLRFLDTFINEMHRSMIEYHLIYCPHTPLCGFAYTNIYHWDPMFESSCVTCSCKNCDLTNICCADLINLESDKRKLNIECHSATLKNIGSTYETVTNCPDSGGSEDDSCFDGDYKAFSDILPVTDTTTNITYKNRNCAVCNHIAEENYVIWYPQLTCDKTGYSALSYKTEKDLIESTNKTEDCNIQFIPTKPAYPIPCLKTINECNVTGNWRNFSSFMSMACESYHNPYRIDKGQGLIIYRNVFCAFCNGELPEYVIVHNPGDGGAPDWPFSGLLNFITDEAATETVDVAEICGYGFVYDTFKEMCNELTCSHMRMFRQNRCETVLSALRNIIYTLTLRLSPINGWYEEFNDLTSLHHALLGALEDKLQNLLSRLNLFPPPEGFIRYNHYNVTALKTICNMILYLSKKAVKTVFYANIHFEIIQKHNLQDIMELSKELEVDILDISLNTNNSVFTFEIQQRDFAVRDDILNYTTEPLNNTFCSTNIEVVNLSKQKSCPLLMLTVTDTDCYENTDGLFCLTLNTTFNASDYHFGNNGSVLFVCSEIYLNHLKHFYKEKETENLGSADATIILSLVCITISLLCLLLSLATFCLFPVLRTLPGKNNMCLIIALFTAQSMFLVSSFSRLESGSVGCKLVGILTHFFWLVAIFWMNICTFHVFRVFIGIRILSGMTDLKSLMFYSAYSFALSVLLVVSNIVVSMLSSDMKDFGYGKLICYINSKRMIGFMFGIPVGFVIITNFVMFAFFVFKIKTAPAVRKDVKNERTDIIIFVKLSTLTGFTWVFGLIYSWTDIEAFSYLFVIVNATQGVFIFLSFVCNKRVINMYRTRAFGVTSSSEAYRIQMTESSRTHITSSKLQYDLKNE